MFTAPVFLTKMDIVRRLHVNDALVAKLIADGNLPGFYLDDQWLTTEKALSEWGDAMVELGTKEPVHIEENATEALEGHEQTPLSAADEELPPLPTLAEARAANWERGGQVRGVVQPGATVWQFVFTIKDKSVPILIEIYGPQGRDGYKNWGARAYFGRVGHGPRPLVEWVHTSDYAHTRHLASAIRSGGKFVRPNDPLPFPQDYGQLELDVYNRVADRPNIRYARCVVANEDDLGTIAIHALIRLRQHGEI